MLQNTKLISLVFIIFLLELTLSQNTKHNSELISTGSIINIKGPLISSSKNVLLSFVINGTNFTMGFLNEAFFITNQSKKQKIATVALSKPIGQSDVYLYFTEKSLNYYESCQFTKNHLIGTWNTTFFQTNQIVYVTGAYTLGNGGLPSLLNEFCSIEDLKTTIKGSSELSVSKKDVISNLEAVDKANYVYRSYLPSYDYLNKIDGLNSISSFNDFSISRSRFLIFSSVASFLYNY